MPTLVARFHHPIQGINKSAQIREAIMHGCTTVEAVQTWLQPKGVQATDGLIKQVLYKSKKNKQLGIVAAENGLRKYHNIMADLISKDEVPFSVKEESLNDQLARVALSFLHARIYAQKCRTAAMDNGVEKTAEMWEKKDEELSKISDVLLDAWKVAIRKT